MPTDIFEQYDHKCLTEPESYPPKKQKESICYKLKRFWFSITLVSEYNSMTVEHFTSHYQLRDERKRHYYSSNYFVIHPLSIFAAIDDFILCLYYSLAIFMRLIDVAFLRQNHLSHPMYELVIPMFNIVDMMTWLNLGTLFFRGLITKKKIIIDLKAIVKYRLTSVFFWAELISSVPKYMICPHNESCTVPVWLFLTALRLFVLFLIDDPPVLLKQTLRHLKFKSRQTLLILHVLVLVGIVTHIMACTGFAISRYNTFFGTSSNNSWIFYNDIINQPIYRQYAYAFFRASAQTFAIKITEFPNITWEEYFISCINYAVGKIMHLLMWVVILNVLLTIHIQEIRFQEISSQLRNWMDNRDLPQNVQKRVVDYYNFHYRKKFFNKKEAQDELPESLMTKVKYNMHKLLKKCNITLFSRLSDHEIQTLADHFETEVYMPRDVILNYGALGTHLYIIAFGTVALYTRSGKEVCHLYDGSYFGELSLILKQHKVTVSVVALETTKIYKLSKRLLDKYILSNQELRKMFVELAQARLKFIIKMEDDYKKELFAEKYKI
ncbi:unnamed protein product [Ceutorhynchus assimilis]|uniref:Cyclic nucleotide-binding domain-containing protein n=1 Tax=Ceutorhynchus assimilis TaxID=467358 RepID=A0A9N9QS51_9CUCU|nr:unnamed protein product [Ceutorhynchus assimilis]